MRRPSAPAPPRLSQHFLRSALLARQLVDAAEVAAGDRVLDIGAGRLTREIAARGARVTAIEVDHHLAERLRVRFSRTACIDVQEGDVLEMSLPAEPYSVVANLPFQHTSAIMHKLLEDARGRLRRAVLVVEWGYACGLTAPRRPTREALEWAPWHMVSLIRRLEASVFDPAPGVAAGVVEVRRRVAPLIPEDHCARYRLLLRHTFTRPQPLKRQLRGRLSSRRWTALAYQLGFASSARPHELDAWQWSALYRAIAGLDAAG